MSDIAGRALVALPPGSLVHLTPSTEVTKGAWDEIRRWHEASAWPLETTERQSQYKTLLSGNGGFADRLSALRDAFRKVSAGGAASVQEGDGGSAGAVEL